MSLIPRFDPATVLTTIERDRAAIFEGVSSMCISLLSQPDLDSYDVSSLRVAQPSWASPTTGSVRWSRLSSRFDPAQRSHGPS
jgi:hypothetical protein